MSSMTSIHPSYSLLRFQQSRLKNAEFGADVVGAGSAELDFAPAPAITQHLKSIVTRGELGYALPRDFFDLFEATSNWHKQTMLWRLQPENLVAAPDITTAFSFVLMTLICPGAPVLVPCPGYPKLRHIAVELGFEVLEYGVRRTPTGYTYALDEIEEHLRGRKQGLVVLLHPHNPTGYLAQKAELEELGKIVDRYGALVFSDEIHAPLWLDNHPHVPYVSVSDVTQQHTVTALSSSKAWGLSGVRVTQIALPDGEVGKRAKRGALSLLGSSVSALGVQASIAAYKESDSWLAELRTRLRANRALITSFAAESTLISDFVPPGSSFLAWIKLGIETGAETASEFLQHRARLGVLGAAEFGSLSTAWFRLNFGSNLETVRRCLSLIARMGNINHDVLTYSDQD